MKISENGAEKDETETETEVNYKSKEQFLDINGNEPELKQIIEEDIEHTNASIPIQKDFNTNISALSNNQRN